MKLQFPTSEVQISKLVKEALSKGQKVRVLGSGHSRNSLAYSEDVIISLHNYRGVIHLEERSKQVTAKGSKPVNTEAILVRLQGYCAFIFTYLWYISFHSFSPPLSLLPRYHFYHRTQSELHYEYNLAVVRTDKLIPNDNNFLASVIRFIAVHGHNSSAN